MNVQEQQTIRKLLSRIERQTKAKNADNISRTNAYKAFYDRHPEIKWSLLASFVSRNAGWSMTDLKGSLFQLGLRERQQRWFFLAYERANWLIFSDAYPQLLLYHWSKKIGKPLFHHLHVFGVSQFMTEEWARFWHERNTERLMYALIINEQNTIQTPIIQNPSFKKNVFDTIPFYLSDWFHFNTVIFPAADGFLYGISVKRFSKTEERIRLGKQLSQLLFSPELFSFFYHFLHTVPHTGSRFDMEKMIGITKRTSPMLRTCYPELIHSLDGKKTDWFHGKIKKTFFRREELPKQIELTEWYLHKKRQLHALFAVQHWLKK
ncbi:DUF2515 domain-containing protein [Bacillus inaquosorum]|uniref:DUF2515 domain-containing protein n=1 Tax=Bacillus inaquosorum TaxID=483913 RepID=UPI0024DE7585|nr:DUF2515 domain-containing protein [Bacillus inaquosorum]WIW28973.1 DUF2515 domain-containing protein [Bacillus inaquosorum]